MVFGTRENHEGRFLLENGLDGYIFWVLVVMGGLDLAACDTSSTSVTSRATMLGGFTRSLSALVHFILHTCA